MKNLLRRLRRKTFRRSEGFSLLEVVIAMAVLAFAFFGMIAVISYTARMNAATRERMWAMRAAERKIEQMLSTTDFDQIYLQFSQNVEGLGWERIRDNDVQGLGFEVLKPVVDSSNTGVSGLDVTQRTVETGYTYPTNFGAPAGPGPYQAVLFVRFPINAAGTGLTEQGAGSFAGLTDANLDLNANGTAGDATNLTVSQCLILPVYVDVYWRGVIGPKSGGTGNNYLRYRYTFLRRTT